MSLSRFSPLELARMAAVEIQQADGGAAGARARLIMGVQAGVGRCQLQRTHRQAWSVSFPSCSNGS